jgi:hypothetical protein
MQWKNEQSNIENKKLVDTNQQKSELLGIVYIKI